jgi:DNA-binding NarL/FixJ family response regulator
VKRQSRRPITILLVDDNEAVRQGLALLLGRDGLAVCTQAAAAGEALARLADAVPDLALVDLSLGEEDGLGLIAALAARGIPVLVCSLHEEPDYVKRALEAGARGYLTKREAPRELLRAIEDVLDGWVMVSPRAADTLPESGRADV